MLIAKTLTFNTFFCELNLTNVHRDILAQTNNSNNNNNNNNNKNNNNNNN